MGLFLGLVIAGLFIARGIDSAGKALARSIDEACASWRWVQDHPRKGTR